MSIADAIASLNGIGTRECHPWREKIIRRHPELAPLICRHYKTQAHHKGYVEANRWLGSLDKELKLARTGLSLDSPEHALRDYCLAKAHNTHKEIYSLVKDVGKTIAVRVLRERVELTGTTLPLPEDHDPEQVVPALARICDAGWWLRKLRTNQWREMEHYIRRHGGVSKRRAIYISDLSYFRRHHQKRRNAALLERLEAENELGQTFTLAELAELSPSNPIVRRHELMTRMRGFENLANKRGDCGLFFTLTCPSKFHVALHTGKRNPNYNGSTPLEAHEWLNVIWQRTRAAWAREGITPYGMRTVEPHHDGTPHWHLMLFMSPDQAKRAVEIFRDYALSEDGDEPGAEKYRIKVIEIDPTKGSATGYIAKYIAKNIDGFNVGADQYGRDAIESAARIEAWASIWGIRQFQQIGGPSVTVWREARRLSPDAIGEQLLQGVVRAADNSDWETFTDLMGGPVCARKARPVRPMLLPKKEESKYGEITRKLEGLWFGALAVVTRVHAWTVRLLPKAHEDKSPGAEAFGFGAPLPQAPPLGGATLEFCQ